MICLKAKNRLKWGGVSSVVQGILSMPSPGFSPQDPSVNQSIKLPPPCQKKNRLKVKLNDSRKHHLREVGNPGKSD